jgi:hypothetical protein
MYFESTVAGSAAFGSLPFAVALNMVVLVPDHRRTLGLK